jgi:hypothetical protein
MMSFNCLVFLTALLLLVQRGKSGSMSPDPITCSSVLGQSVVQHVQLALADMKAMAAVAYDRHAGYQAGTSPQRDRRAVACTFNTYFGLYETVNGVAQVAPNAQARIDGVASKCVLNGHVRLW